MAKLSAASRLRDQVLSVPNTVLLIAAGHPDKVVRFNRLPDSIKDWRKIKASERSEEDLRTVHTPLDLDRGPDSECYVRLMDEIRKNSRRDIPAPEPLTVAENSNEEWGIGNEDVPVVELNSIIPVSSHSIKETALEAEEPEAKKRGRPRKEVIS